MAKIFLSFQIFQQRLKIFLNFVLCDAVAPIWRDPLPNLTTRDLNSERNVEKIGNISIAILSEKYNIVEELSSTCPTSRGEISIQREI